MTEPRHTTSSQVLIVGGGVAALEALLALRALAGDRADVTLVAPDDWFVDRPVTVVEPFGLGAASRHSLPEITAELGARFVRATVTAVHGAERRVSCAGGPDIDFDTLVLTPGARASSALAGTIAFGLKGSIEAVKDMLSRLRAGEARSAAFIAPSTTGWLLPLYELSLMTARELAQSNVGGATLRLITPEEGPLALFGEAASQSVGRLLSSAGIEFVGSSADAGELVLGTDGKVPAADCVVTLPLLRGPALAGVPGTQPHGFVPVDEHGRVHGLSGVYAAGDATEFPIKQGGLAAQQADAVAEHIAAGYGAPVEPTPFRPVLRGMLFTGGEPRFLRHDVGDADAGEPAAWYPLWWPPTKIAGRYLSPYLLGRTDEESAAPHPQGFVDVEIPLTEATLPA